MKKVLVLLVIVFSIFLVTGCKEEKKEAKWEYIANVETTEISEKAMKVFEKATKDYTDMKLEAVSLLGTQVVAGTNYMFLCNSDSALKIAIIYNDLKGNASVTSVKDFDASNYVDKDNDVTHELVSGAWKVTEKYKEATLEKSASMAFKKSVATLTGVKYTPIALLGTKKDNGTHYSFLCYGKISLKDPIYSLYVLTVFDNEKGSVTLSNVYELDIASFNE